MDKLKKEALERFIPIVRDKTAQALCQQCKLLQPRKILEIGTAIGYSALLMLKSCNAQVFTIEKNHERFLEAQSNLKDYINEGRVKLFEDDASAVLEQLVLQGEMFDFVFLDGPKGQYIHYLPNLYKLLNKNGVIFADNVKLLGLVNDESKVTHKNRAMVNNMKQFIDQIQNNGLFDTQIFDIEDGYSISVKR